MIYSLPLFLMLMMSCTSENDFGVTDDKIHKETIVVVVAHPDDETAIGGVIAKYARDHDVYLIIATDGSYGVTDHAGIPEGDSLVLIRNAEAACSCAALGAHPPMHLNLIDGLGFYARGNFYEQMSTMKKKLHEEFQKLQPSIVLSFGPDGDTGHHDHRLVGSMTSEVLLSRDEYRDVDLYYYGWTKQQADKYPDWNLGYVSETYLDTTISYTDEDEVQAFASIRCHKSQFSQSDMDRWISIEKADSENTSYFRTAMQREKRSTSF